MRTLPSLAVCIPCVPKHLSYLGDCLQSIVDQTQPADEVIVAVSSLDSAESRASLDRIVSHFQARLPLTIISTPEPRYAGINRNVAVEASQSELIVFMDADDLLYPTKLEITKKVFAEDPEVLGLFHYFRENTFVSKTQIKLHDDNFDPNLIRDYWYDEKLHFGHAAYRKSVFETQLFSDKPRGQDIEFADKLLRAGLQHQLRIYTAPLTFYLSNRSLFFLNPKPQAPFFPITEPAVENPSHQESRQRLT